MKLKLKDILPNPYRDLKLNPLDEEKITSLIDSINATGFWENVVVRKNTDGNYELAYGHNRLEAAIRADIEEADFIVKDFSEAEMIQVMDSENRETYGASPLTLIESVKAVVKALAKGTIGPFAVDPKVRKDTIRYAPSFVSGDVGLSSPQIPYTALHIAEFLGRTRVKERVKGRPEEISRKPEDAIIAALNYLQLQEKGRVSEDVPLITDTGGGVRHITVNELLKRTTAMKKDYERTEKTEAQRRKEEAELHAERVRLENEEKERKRKEREEYDESVRLEAKAKAEKRKEEIAKIKAERKAAEEQQEADQFEYQRKKLELEEKVKEAKRVAEEQRKVDEYAPIRREVARILGRMEQTKVGLVEEIKALARKPLSLKDRELLWEKAAELEAWYGEWVKAQFVDPSSFTPKRKKGARR